jgi:hypothetical protein
LYRLIPSKLSEENDEVYLLLNSLKKILKESPQITAKKIELLFDIYSKIKLILQRYKK